MYPWYRVQYILGVRVLNIILNAITFRNKIAAGMLNDFMSCEIKISYPDKLWNVNLCCFLYHSICVKAVLIPTVSHVFFSFFTKRSTIKFLLILKLDLHIHTQTDCSHKSVAHPQSHLAVRLFSAYY